MLADRRRNRRTFAALALVALGMVGLAYASVPLYRLFCQVTGFGGTPQRVAAAPEMPAGANERFVTIRFNADIVGPLPWRFEPVQREIVVKVGERLLAFYRATNLADREITGQATYNVTPDKAGRFFDKIDCFCFTEQRLAAGETAEMPVSFFVDPSILLDRGMDEVKTITLSYTFFLVPDGPEQASGASPTPLGGATSSGTDG